MKFRFKVQHTKVIFLTLWSGGWVGEGGVEKLTLKLSQLPTKLKLKLKLSLAIIITALGAGGVVCVCRPIFATLGPNLGIQLD